MKTNLNYLKRIVILIFAVGTLSSADGCFGSGDEDIDCSECVSAQIHLCDALGRTNGRLDQAQNAVDKVKKACGSLGSAKVTKVHTDWLNNPTENCNSRGFTCD